MASRKCLLNNSRNIGDFFAKIPKNDNINNNNVLFAENERTKRQEAEESIDAQHELIQGDQYSLSTQGNEETLVNIQHSVVLCISKYINFKLKYNFKYVENRWEF